MADYDGEDHPPAEQWPSIKELRRHQLTVEGDTQLALGLRLVDGALLAPTLIHIKSLLKQAVGHAESIIIAQSLQHLFLATVFLSGSKS